MEREAPLSIWHTSTSYTSEKMAKLDTEDNPSLSSQASISSINFGTGSHIFTTTLLPALESAEQEILFVTCFWAKSISRDRLSDTLLRLSANRLSNRGHVQSSLPQKLRVRFGFSSSSLFQKLFHPQTSLGREWTAQECTNELGLPAAERIPGLDLQVRSKFFLPFSVWHPKFIVIDRKRVFLPSCNVSWEDWFEGCAEITGSVVQHFVKFWRTYWAGTGEDLSATSLAERDADGQGEHLIPCKFLPSPHHRNPQFRFPWQEYAYPPKTPLNTEILRLLENTQKEIYIQTPNITSPPVLDALKGALTRGVNITILTSERLMILEQLVTAGTTTSRCVQSLISFHKRLLQKPEDEEAGLIRPGTLRICYYVPLASSKSGLNGGPEPVQSHLKLTVVDGCAIVFGSGNMDRASWYTSQELGVAFFSEDLVARTMQSLRVAMTGRSKLVYDSSKS